MIRFIYLLVVVSASASCNLLVDQETASDYTKMEGFVLSNSNIKCGLPSSFHRKEIQPLLGEKSSTAQIIQKMVGDHVAEDEAHVDLFSNQAEDRWLMFVNSPLREISKVTTSLENLKIEASVKTLETSLPGWSVFRRGSSFRKKRHLEYAKYQHFLTNTQDTTYITRYVTNVSDRTCTIIELGKGTSDFEPFITTMSVLKTEKN